MAQTVIMPKLGFNMSEGVLVKWYKSEGDPIAKGENFFSVETDKTAIDIEATADGVVRRLLAAEGDSVPVTQPIAIVGTADEDISGALAAAPVAAPAASAPVTAPENAAAPATAPVAPAVGGYDYDVLVIGGGPGGYVAAIAAAQRGKKTALAERGSLGGVCLNEGCIPTKTLLRSAAALAEAKNLAEFGITGLEGASPALDMAAVQARKRSIVERLVGGVGGLVRGNGITLLAGEAAMIDGHTVTVDGRAVTAGNLIIATGSQPRMLPVPVEEGRRVLTSADMLEMETLPASALVAGGGVIGVEFAYLLAALGVQVTLVEMMERILPDMDEELAATAAGQLKDMGVALHTGAKITAFTKAGLTFEKNGKTQEALGEQVLCAVGRAPRTPGIDCEALGIRTERGAIVTDGHMRTSLEGVYAIGDVNGKSMLAHTASMEGLVAVDDICGAESEMDYGRVPGVVYIQPEIAAVGLSEQQARQRYGDIRVGRFPLSANGKALVEGDDRGFVKVISEAKYGEIVGVHMACPHAGDMIAEAVMAMALEGTDAEMARVIHPHPTVSEALMEALHAAHDRAIHNL